MVTGNTTEQRLGNFLKASLLEIMGILHAECGSLFLFDASNKELVLDTFQNTKKLNFTKVRCRLGEGVSGKVIERQAAVLVKDIDTDHRFSRNGFAHYHTKSFISVPLVGPSGLVGLINIADRSDRQAFTEKDLEFAKRLAEYACIIAYNAEVSEKLRKEKEESDRQRFLLEKYASVGKLAAGVVHEINSPLDGVLRFTNLLLAQVQQKTTAYDYLSEIKLGLERIEGITRSLLQFSHQVNQGAAKRQNWILLNDMLDESLGIFNPRFKDQAVELKKDYLPFKYEIFDAGIAHVFMNLVKNALDAMPRGGLLNVYVRRRGNDLCVVFKDTGGGIPVAIQDKIFEPFFTTKVQTKGTGLGLAICREIMTRYNGAIELESTLQEGSVFTVVIPADFARIANEPA